MPPLSAKRRSELRAEAHSLGPIVIIGDKGLTDEVVAEIDRSLKAHELIKVRAAAGERDARDAWLATICERLQAHPVQQIGKIFVLFRENPKEKEVKRPKRPEAEAKAGGERKKPRASSLKTKAAEAKGTSRPRSRTPSPRPASAPPRRRPRTSR